MVFVGENGMKGSHGKTSEHGPGVEGNSTTKHS
jgi:hypothetical protein